MVHRVKKEPAWKQSLREVADNPEYIYQEMEALKKELEMNNPDPSYMKEKVRHIDQWVEEIAKFHTTKGIYNPKTKKFVKLRLVR
jgi:hypothetical protein